MDRLLKVESVLSEKFEEAVMILPSHLRDGFREYGYFAGGCIYSLYNDKEPKDYDIFFSSKEYVQHILNYFRKFVDAGDFLKGLKPFANGKYRGRKLIISEYAVTIGEFQLIVKYIGEPDDVATQFDFKHNEFTFRDGCITNHTDWDYLSSTELAFNDERARDICGTILRIPKFIDKGMTITRCEIAKMLRSLDEAGFSESEKNTLKFYEQHY